MPIGELFAECPVDAYPGVAVESVIDSSRYFVLRIKDGTGMSLYLISIVLTFHFQTEIKDISL